MQPQKTVSQHTAAEIGAKLLLDHVGPGGYGIGSGMGVPLTVNMPFSNWAASR